MATARRRTRAEDVDDDTDQPQAKRPRISAVNGYVVLKNYASNLWSAMREQLQNKQKIN